MPALAMLQALAPAGIVLLSLSLIENNSCRHMEEVFVFEYTEETHLREQVEVERRCGESAGG